MQPDEGQSNSGKIEAKKDDLSVEQLMQSLVKGISDSPKQAEVKGDHGMSNKEDRDMYSTRDPTPVKQ